MELTTQSPNSKLSEARNRMPVNLISNASWLVLSIAVNMWYTPYLIDHLGVAVFGLVPLVSSAVRYLSVLTQGLNSAVSRFLVVDLARDGVDAANHTFNTALASGAIISAILFVFALLGAWFAPVVFDIPPGYERDVQWLVLFVIFALMLTMFASSFAVSSFAYHRFDLRFLVQVIRLVIRIGIIVVLFSLLSPRLWQVGLGLFIASFFFLLGHGMLWRKLTPELMIRLDLFNSRRLKQMLGFSGWVLVNQVGSLLFLNIDLIVANLIFGATVAGKYGAVIIFPALLRSLAATVNGVLMPIIITLYAQNNLSGLVRLSRLSVKFMGLAMALPIGLLCGLGIPLLTIWLGPEFSDLSWLVIVLIGHLCINIAVIPLFSLQVATGSVRIPGIVTLLMGGANAVLAVALALWGGWGYVGIAAAGAIVLTAKNAFFTPFYGARILQLPWFIFFPSMIAGIVGCLAVGAGTYLVSSMWTLTSWGQLAFVGLITSGIYVSAAYLLGLDADDRRLLKLEVQRRIKR